MLTQYLKDIYRSKVASKSGQAFDQLTRNWTSQTNSSIFRKFTFDSFKQAAVFQSIANDLLANNQVHFSVQNVYNTVTIHIEEKYLNELTVNEVQSALQLDEIYEMKNPVEFIVNKNYQTYEYLYPRNLNVEINHQVETSSTLRLDHVKRISHEEKNELI